ncbi:MAG: hypothetical protein LDL24_04210 [Treponema sp.]|nr:hypothetical protein [Treponema sp.]
MNFVIIAEEKGPWLENTDWIKQFGSLERFQFEYYGEITSIRAFFNEYEVEFGIGSPLWIALPLDEGTKQVINDGYKIIYNRDGALQSLLDSSGID